MSDSLRRRVEKLEDRIVIRDVPIYRELTEPINEFGYPSPVIEITKTRDGRLYQPLRLLTLDEIRRDEKLRSHPRLAEILAHQEKCIERDEEYRDMLFRDWGPLLLREAVLVTDGVKNWLEIPLSPIDPEGDKELDDQVFFNVYEYGFTPAQAFVWADIQLQYKADPEFWEEFWEKTRERILKDYIEAQEREVDEEELDST